MNRDSRLLDLVVQYEELRAEGRQPSLESLCRDCPDLREDLQACLRSMGRMDALLDAGQVPRRSSGPLTEPLGGPVTMPALPLRDWPAIPGYEILAELGRGGMGVVFKARQVALGRTVALKMILPHDALHEEQKRRFLAEAKAMALLQHPNIVQIYEIGQHHEHPFLVMEYVEGEALSALLVGNPMPPRKAAELVAVLARAVHAAHMLGIIHRDLKPGNVLMAPGNTPKICDFGLAKHFDNAADQTRTAQPLGTPSYMAPEQISTSGPGQGPAVDIYALGAALYETLTGRPPFLAASPLDTLQLVLTQEPVPPRRWQPKTPRDLETIVLKCLAKDPRRRYATARELAEDLDRFAAGAPIHARPVGPLERTWRWCRSHPSLAGLIAVAAVAIVVVMALVVTYNRRLGAELGQTEAARRQVVAAHQRLQRVLTDEIAERLDGDLRELATVPRTMAALLESRAEWDQPRLEQVCRDLLAGWPQIFGLGVAFEPHQWRPDQQDFALYVYRHAQTFAVKQLLPPDYLPVYREWEWYRVAKDAPQGRWSEPYIGEGGDNTPMVSYSAPIRRNGRFVGVVTADLAMAYFRDLRRTVDRLGQGSAGYTLVVSSRDRILAHPLDRCVFPSPDSYLDRIPLDPTFRRLMHQWAEEPFGSAQAIDFSTGRPTTYLFARIPTTGWTVVTAEP